MKILIIDDSSKREFLKDDNMPLDNCKIIYDTEHTGAGELLPYYYFHKLKPFDTAVIIHDSIFIQTKINFELEPSENIRFLWNFVQCVDTDMFEMLQTITSGLKYETELLNMYHQLDKWMGCFGVMSVIRWNFIDTLNTKYNIFDCVLPKIKSRTNRYPLERLIGLISYFEDPQIKPAYFGIIQHYMPWGITFSDYKTQDFSNYPIIKVWSGR